MKKLGELGISPTPWGFAKPNKTHDANIYCDERARGGLKRTYMFAVRYPYAGLLQDRSVLREQTANARLIVAAPKLYDELWKQCFGEIGTINCRNCKGAELGNCQNCKLGGARAALAEAAGESEVRDER